MGWNISGKNLLIFKTHKGKEICTINIIRIYLIHFRDEYDNVAFIYASDDMSWGHKHLNGIKDLYLIGAGQNLDEETKREIVDPDAASYDLALLVNCNHTIITRGTYTMWIAMLAGGEYYSEYGVVSPDYTV